MTGGLEMVAQHRGVSITAEALDTHVSDRCAQGGVLNEPSIAVSWYAPTNIRAELDYACALLHRDGGTGRTQLVTMRLQWELR